MRLHHIAVLIMGRSCLFVALFGLMALQHATNAQQTQLSEPTAHGFKSSDLQIAMSMKKVGRLHEVMYDVADFDHTPP